MIRYYRIPTHLYPDPSKTITTHYAVERYHFMLTTVFFNSWNDDEAYSVIAGWLEDDWDWSKTPPQFFSDGDYHALLNAFYEAYQVFNRHIQALKPVPVFHENTINVVVEIADPDPLVRTYRVNENLIL